MIKLTEKEQNIYDKIIAIGTMQDMFDLAYVIGRERILAEMIEHFNGKTSLE